MQGPEIMNDSGKNKRSFVKVAIFDDWLTVDGPKSENLIGFRVKADGIVDGKWTESERSFYAIIIQLMIFLKSFFFAILMTSFLNR